MIHDIDHIGIAVRSIAQARIFYEQGLGLVCAAEEEVASQKVRVALFPLGTMRIELLEPTSPQSPVARFLDRFGEGVHHIALRCDDLAGQLARMKEAGLRLINETPVIGAGGRQIAFIHPKAASGVLIELCGSAR